MITITVKHTRVARADPAIMERVRQPLVLAQALAQRVVERVSLSGDTATPAKPYQGEVRSGRQRAGLSKARQRTENAIASARFRGDSKRVSDLTRRLGQLDNAQQNAGGQERGYTISEEYARALGLSQTTFPSSAAFHAATGVKPGSARVTGGMWRGIQVRNVGSNAAVVDFGGSSVGGSRQSSTTKGGRKRTAVPLVRNQIKGGTVFRQSSVNVLQPKDTENEAMAAAVCRWSQQLLARTLGATAGEFTTTSDRALLAGIMRLHNEAG